MSPSNRILFSGVSRLNNLINNPFASYSFTNLGFLILHTAYFDSIIILPYFVLEIFESKFSLFYLHFKQ